MIQAIGAGIAVLSGLYLTSEVTDDLKDIAKWGAIAGVVYVVYKVAVK